MANTGIAVPQGRTALTMPFGSVTLTRPSAYYVNRDARSGAISGVNAVVIELPIIVGARNSITVLLKCYLNRAQDGSYRPKVAWPRGLTCSPDLKTLALAHASKALRDWPGRQGALADAYRALVAEATGKAPKGTGEVDIPFEPPADTMPTAPTEPTDGPVRLTAEAAGPVASEPAGQDEPDELEAAEDDTDGPQTAP